MHSLSNRAVIGDTLTVVEAVTQKVLIKHTFDLSVSYVLGSLRSLYVYSKQPCDGNLGLMQEIVACLHMCCW